MGGDKKARKKMLIASCFAGMVIAQTSTTLAHAMGYPLTIEKGIKHGKATGMVLPLVMEIMKEEIPARVNEVNRIFGGSLLNFLRRLGLYQRVEVSQEELERWSERAARAKHVSNTPGTFTKEKIMTIYREVLNV